MPDQKPDPREDWAGEVDKKQQRKLAHRREGDRSVWFGLGMFGLVGWSVAIPTVIGVALGVWLDSLFESQRSWTLIMLVLGICVGCLNAWWWVKRESSDE